MRKVFKYIGVLTLCLGPVTVTNTGANAQQANYQSSNYSGMWFWAPQHWGRPDAKKNLSTLKINPDLKTANYCYNNQCWFYPITWTPDGGFNFTTDSKNYFEMTFDGKTKINGSFWLSLDNGMKNPDAKIVFLKQ